MAQRQRSFETYGQHAVNFVQYFKQKLEEAEANGLGIDSSIFDWQEFCDTNPTALQAAVAEYPGPADDHPKRVRQNFARQVNRFIKWLNTGTGN